MGTRHVMVIAVVASLCWCGVASAQDAKVPPEQTYAVTVTQVDNHGKWEIAVYNTNPKGFISTFWWIPPIGMTVNAVTSVKGGTCVLAKQVINCKGNIAPPSCNTCIGDKLTADFNATGDTGTFVNTSYGGYWIHYGVRGFVYITSVTPFSDLAKCKQGQVSTKAKPCSPAT